jgi:hypothetical protein
VHGTPRRSQPTSEQPIDPLKAQAHAKDRQASTAVLQDNFVVLTEICMILRTSRTGADNDSIESATLHLAEKIVIVSHYLQVDIPVFEKSVFQIESEGIIIVN